MTARRTPTGACVRWGMVAAMAGAVALGAGLSFAAPADAVPIRDLRQTVDPGGVSYRALVLSPPTARHCYANVQALVVRTRPFRVVRSHGNRRVNVCQTGASGWTGGVAQGRLSMVGVRAGRYFGCLRAVQTLRNGRNSSHIACRPVIWRG